MKEITMYVGKNQIKVDLDNLLDTQAKTLQAIPYSVAHKYPEFISALEVCIEDCLDVAREIHDELTYGLAIAEMVVIINGEDEGDGEVEEATTIDNNNLKEDADMLNENTNTTNNVQEEEAMKKAMEEMNQKAGIKDLLKNVKETVVHSVVDKAKKTKEEYVAQVDESANVVKGALVTVLDKASKILGTDTLKQSILGIIEAGSTNGKLDLDAMAKDCRDRLDVEIATLIAWGSEDDLRKAAQLKALNEGERGKSIIESLFACLIWIAKKIAKTLRQWFQVDNEKSILGAICRSLSGLVVILREGARLVWHTAKFAISFVVAGAIKVGAWVYNTFMTFVHAIKGWFERCKESADDFEDDFDYDDMLDDDDEFVFAEETEA